MYLSFAGTEVNTVPDLLDILLKYVYRKLLTDESQMSRCRYPYDRRSVRVVDPPHVQVPLDK